ncbi:hypothetical protein D9M72_516690 [compost metagenome]
MRARSRVTSVGVMYSGYWAMASFSEWSRIARGLLNTRAPCDSASSSSQVLVTYSMSKGGSLRISTASKAESGSSALLPSRYQALWSASLVSPVRCRRVATVSTVRPDSASCGCRHQYSSWPRAAASVIMA